MYVQLTTGRFSDLRLTSRLLPIHLWRTVDKDHKRTPLRLAVLKCLSDFRLTIGADAYSGAPVSAFNRVPVWLSQTPREGSRPATASAFAETSKAGSQMWG